MKNENKQVKASSWALGILFVLSAAVLVMFFGVGYGDTEYLNNSTLTAPRYTGVLLIWLYALVAICAGAIVVFGIASAFRSLKSKTQSAKTGFAGIVFLLTFVMVGVSYFLANTEPLRLGNKKLVDTVWELVVSDMCLYSIYALVVVSLLCSLMSMLGIFKSKSK